MLKSNVCEILSSLPTQARIVRMVILSFEATSVQLPDHLPGNSALEEMN